MIYQISSPTSTTTSAMPDFSREAFERHIATQARIACWVDDTNSRALSREATDANVKVDEAGQSRFHYLCCFQIYF